MTFVEINLALDKEQFEKWTDFLVWLKEDKNKKGQLHDKNAEPSFWERCPSCKKESGVVPFSETENHCWHCGHRWLT